MAGDEVMKRLSALLFAGVLLSVGVASAKDAEEAPSAREAALSQLDQLEPVVAYLISPQFIASRSELSRVDRTPVPELIVIATDKKKKPFVRERALKCLSLFREKQVQLAFSQLLAEKLEPQLFPFAAMAYLEAFGEEAVPDLKPFLGDANAEVRVTVVKGFGLFGGQAGYDLLVERDKEEENPRVLAEIRSYIQ
jgi:HEAT repeat protein